MIEKARCSPLPFFSMSQNLHGELASPGKRHAKPTTAIGTSTVVCAEGILMSEKHSLYSPLSLEGDKPDRRSQKNSLRVRVLRLINNYVFYKEVCKTKNQVRRRKRREAAAGE